jgi:signal transduction histidine kinase
VDEMSSERFRERLLSAEQPAIDRGRVASGLPGRSTAPSERSSGPLHRSLVTDVPLPASARWNPQNWRLRTKLVALTVVPLLLAVVLGALQIADSAKNSSSAAVRDAVIIGVALLLCLALLIVVARSILKPVRVLRASAFDVADRRLPAVIEQLRTTEGRTKNVKIEPVPVYSREDVGQVARAFDAVHSEAVRLASEQAALRANVNDMFVNLSRRTQGLVERQLRLIDDLELGEQDADRLGSLFRLDHLATRMRRNGENLLVLAGAELRQRSGEPVPVVDVLRAAVSEIEDYQRVLVQPLPRAMVSGLAVNDIVHLVAELLDNASAYSDPETQVELSARFADEGGLVVEIRDAGTGLRRPQLIDINQRLAVPSAIDVSVSRHMGLFVVGRLANRHGISVQLTSSDGSGVTVTVALPKELITTEAASVLRRSDYLGRLASQDVSLAGAENGSVSYRPSASPNYQTSFADAVPSQQPGLLDDPTSINGNTDDTPIFASMLSRWFTEREEKPAAADEFTYYAGAATEQEGWESDADAGWQAAEAASEPAVDEITAAGLPKRRPQAFLVPGSAAPGPITNGQSSPPPARHASAVRDRMSSFQRGLTMGRHARPVKPVDESGAHQDWPDEETAEGNQ